MVGYELADQLGTLSKGDSASALERIVSSKYEIHNHKDLDRTDVLRDVEKVFHLMLAGLQGLGYKQARVLDAAVHD